MRCWFKQPDGIYCGYTCNDPSSMSRHRRARNHPRTLETPYSGAEAPPEEQTEKHVGRKISARREPRVPSNYPILPWIVLRQYDPTFLKPIIRDTSDPALPPLKVQPTPVLSIPESTASPAIRAVAVPSSRPHSPRGVPTSPGSAPCMASDSAATKSSSPSQSPRPDILASRASSPMDVCMSDPVAYRPSADAWTSHKAVESVSRSISPLSWRSTCSSQSSAELQGWAPSTPPQSPPQSYASPPSPSPAPSPAPFSHVSTAVATPPSRKPSPTGNLTMYTWPPPQRPEPREVAGLVNGYNRCVLQCEAKTCPPTLRASSSLDSASREIPLLKWAQWD